MNNVYSTNDVQAVMPSTYEVTTPPVTRVYPT